MHNLLLNTIVFKAALDAGDTAQSDLVALTRDLGFSGIEVRREYLPAEGNDASRAGELGRIAAEASRCRLDVFYSVPEPMFVGGRPSPLLATYLDEAAQLGATGVKLNTGETDASLRDTDAQALGELAAQLAGSAARVTIENDQTAANGTLDFVTGMLRTFRERNLPVGFTFDVGNWLWLGEDPLTAARALGEFSTVFHLKDATTENGLHTELLDGGAVDWRGALAEMNEIPVVIEYPIADADTIRAEVAKVTAALVAAQALRSVLL